MKNHYKIHAQHQEDSDNDSNDGTLTKKIDATKYLSANPTKAMIGAAAPAMKSEMLDWLRSDFDRVDLSSTTTGGLKSDRVIRSMRNLSVQENKDEDGSANWIHLE